MPYLPLYASQCCTSDFRDTYPRFHAVCETLGVHFVRSLLKCVYLCFSGFLCGSWLLRVGLAVFAMLPLGPATLAQVAVSFCAAHFATFYDRHLNPALHYAAGCIDKASTDQAAPALSYEQTLYVCEFHCLCLPGLFPSWFT